MHILKLSMSEEVKVISWNILASEWIVKKDYTDINKTTLFNNRKRIKTIIETLNNYNADIILLQEVMPDEYKIMYKYFKDEYHITEILPIKWSYRNTNNHKSESGNITMLRKSKYNIIQFNLDKDLSSKIMQFCKITQCMNIKTNKVITLYNIHLDDLSSVKRNKQMKQIVDFNNELYSKASCIIAGDFNQVYRENSKLYNIAKFIVHNFCNTYYIEKNINIDNILTKGFKENKSLAKCENFAKDTEDIFKKIGSDHTPVIANIVL